MTSLSRRCFAAALGLAFASRPTGRLASAASLTPCPASERRVGMSYTNWFRSGGQDWAHTWGRPALGYYASSDPGVLRQHADWLTGANIDFVLLDESNEIGADWIRGTGDARSLARRDATTALFEEWGSHGRSPKIAFLLGGNPASVFTNGTLDRKVDEIYELFVGKGRYKPLLERYLGKPLLVVFIGPTTTGKIARGLAGSGPPYDWTEGKPAWSDDRFTVRFMGGFLTDQYNMVGPGGISRFGYWSWEDRGAPSYPVFGGHPEVATVVASWQASPLHPPRGREEGRTYLDSWSAVRRLGPQFALVTTFNEWWTGEQHDAAFSRDIEPSAQDGDLYLRLTRQQAALFKNGF